MGGASARTGDDEFTKDVAEGFRNRTAAFFVLLRKVAPDRVLAELEGLRGKVLQTFLSQEKEEKLQAEQVRREAGLRASSETGHGNPRRVVEPGCRHSVRAVRRRSRVAASSPSPSRR